MKMKEGMEVKVYTFLSENYTDISGQLQTLAALPLGERTLEPTT